MSSSDESVTLRSDLALDRDAFHPARTSQSTRDLNDLLIKNCKADTKWWECGAQEYRRRRAAGETPFPLPVKLENAHGFTVTSTKGGHEIPCRWFGPREGTDALGVFYHIHGGGWVLGSAAGQDLLLNEIATKAQLVVVSVDYRLAPEHPFPAALEDSFEVADWLVSNSKQKWHCDLKFIGGESAGATLTSMVRIHLRQTRKDSTVQGIVLSYMCADLSLTPSVRALDVDKPLILSFEDAAQFIDAYLPNMKVQDRRTAEISPVCNDLSNLGSALFICGTEDGLTDDTILMGAKWQLTGNEAIVKFVAGGCHGFMTFDGNRIDVTRQGWDILLQYLQLKLSTPNRGE